jgi:hypothetical protein
MLFGLSFFDEWQVVTTAIWIIGNAQSKVGISAVIKQLGI